MEFVIKSLVIYIEHDITPHTPLQYGQIAQFIYPTTIWANSTLHIPHYNRGK